MPQGWIKKLGKNFPHTLGRYEIDRKNLQSDKLRTAFLFYEEILEFSVIFGARACISTHIPAKFSFFKLGNFLQFVLSHM
jgi:hypothetical protein